jgi:hypothetical protein
MTDHVSRAAAVAALEAIDDKDIAAHRVSVDAVDENAAVEACLAAINALPPAAPALDVEAAARPPIAVILAVEILCNHVEPGWDNSKAIVRAWIDEERAARAILAAATRTK